MQKIVEEWLESNWKSTYGQLCCLQVLKSHYPELPSNNQLSDSANSYKGESVVK